MIFPYGKNFARGEKEKLIENKKKPSLNNRNNLLSLEFREDFYPQNSSKAISPIPSNVLVSLKIFHFSREINH